MERTGRHISEEEQPPDHIRPPFLTRRRLQIILGFLWLLDGALQLQPFMFSSGFAKSAIAPSAIGQPTFVSAPVEWNAHLIAAHPVLLNAVFASVQLLLGIGFLFRATARVAVVGSVGWALGVWYLGEGLGGIAGGHVTGLVGAPGAALLYGVLALAAWPRQGPRGNDDTDDTVRPARWIVAAWAALWVGLAVLSSLPSNRPAPALSGPVAMNATAVPSWLASMDRVTATVIRAGGGWSVAALIAAELLIGLCALGRSPMRVAALWGGIALALLFWAVGQSFGQLLSGQATDLNTGPLVILLGLTAAAAADAGSRPRVRTLTLSWNTWARACFGAVR